MVPEEFMLVKAQVSPAPCTESRYSTRSRGRKQYATSPGMRADKESSARATPAPEQIEELLPMPTPVTPGSQQAPEVLQVVAEDPKSLQDDLDRAVEQILATAMPRDRRGVLVTRRSLSLFTVEASNDVPPGTILEKDRWHRPVTHPSPEPGDGTGL